LLPAAVLHCQLIQACLPVLLLLLLLCPGRCLDQLPYQLRYQACCPVLHWRPQSLAGCPASTLLLLPLVCPGCCWEPLHCLAGCSAPCWHQQYLACCLLLLKSPQLPPLLLLLLVVVLLAPLLVVAAGAPSRTWPAQWPCPLLLDSAASYCLILKVQDPEPARAHPSTAQHAARQSCR
jgi:hypothetical protein